MNLAPADGLIQWIIGSRPVSCDRVNTGTGGIGCLNFGSIISGQYRATWFEELH